MVVMRLCEMSSWTGAFIGIDEVEFDGRYSLRGVIAKEYPSIIGSCRLRVFDTLGST